METLVLVFAVWSLFARAAIADNDFTYTGTPVAGQAFTVTWNPGTYTTIDILLYQLTGFPYYVPTTSEPIAQGIANSGIYVWNVPANLGGFFSLSIARDFNFPVSYSPKFALGPYTFSTIQPVTSVPQTTACTSALPQPTGANPFLIPDESSVLRVGDATNIRWQPTTKGTVSLILNPSISNSYEIASATILSNISNSGSFAWTPPNDSLLDGTGVGGWFLTLVDDATQETSDSASFNILPPDSPDKFIGPYSPPVLGQSYTFNWSPSTAPTISLLIIKAVPYSTVNITLADRIKNTGSFTWSVPTSDAVIIPGEWEFSLINDANGAVDASIFLVIDSTSPALCGPQTSDALSSELASFRNRLSSEDSGPTRASITTTAYSLLSIFASLSSEIAAKETKVTPHVLTTLPAATASATGTGSTTGAGQFLDSESGTSGGVISSTSRAGGVAIHGRRGLNGNERGNSGIWELSAAMWGLFVGLLGVFL